VILDVELTDELIAEGLARDLVRMIQQARKDAGLHVSDRIELALFAPEAITNAAQVHRAYIAEQTLATSLSFSKAVKPGFTAENTLEGQKVTIGLSKAA
jgi:isoleucyl-tRNA synthetase